MRDTDDSAPDLVESPQAAFSVLGDETRLSILLELAREAGERGPEAGLSFGTLRERVGVTDSGRFNYHLDRLRSGFVEKVDGEYRARYAGLQVVSTVYAGVYDDTGRATAESSTECPECGVPLEIRHEDARLELRCAEHGLLTGYPVPPGALESRTLPEALTLAMRRAMSEMALSLDGICQRCWGRVDLDWPVDPSQAGETPGEWRWAQVDCERCWLRYQVPLRTLVTALPVVRSLYTRHGYDQVDAIVGPRATGYPGVCTVTVEDGRPTVTVDLDDETLTLSLDGDLRLRDATSDGRDGHSANGSP